MNIHEKNFVKYLQSGKEEALDYVIDVYLPRIKGVVIKTLGPINQQEMIGECINDILLSIWKNAKKFKGDANAFEKWVCVIAKYKSIDYYRTAIKKKESSTSPMEFSLTDTSDDFVKQLEDQHQIMDLLEELEPVDKKIFIMRYLLDLHPEEIAKQMQMTKSAVDNRIYRGKKKIKSHVKTIEGGILNEGHV